MRRTVALWLVVVGMCIGGVAGPSLPDARAQAAEPAEASAAPTTTRSEIDAGTYAVRLRDLEQRINELKEEIFRSKARLSLLAETVLEGVHRR